MPICNIDDKFHFSPLVGFCMVPECDPPAELNQNKTEKVLFDECFDNRQTTHKIAAVKRTYFAWTHARLALLIGLVGHLASQKNILLKATRQHTHARTHTPRLRQPTPWFLPLCKCCVASTLSEQHTHTHARTQRSILKSTCRQGCDRLAAQCCGKSSRLS